MATSKAPALVGISLAGFRSPEEVRAYQDAARAQFGAEPRFELSYTLDGRFLQKLAFLKGRILSVHAPCPWAEFFPNLGSRDGGVRMAGVEAVRRSAGTAARFGAARVVLHPGYTLDQPVPVDPVRRLAELGALTEEEQRQVWIREGSICRKGYCLTPSYRAHLEAAVEGLEEAAGACAAEGVVLAVENLNPRLTYLFQLPDELVRLAAAIPALSLCVDIGHLWISSLVHGFGFEAGLEVLLATGRVRSAHIHDNGSRLGADPVLSDDHAHVGTGSVPVAEALAMLTRAGIPALVVETTTHPLESMRRVLALLRETSPGIRPET
jgi:sugar phosphate isomerase/epimerase